MGADVKTEFKIPDLWFDLYARLIPGIAFVTAIRFWSLGISTIPKTDEIFILLGLGYFAGLLTQPISSALARKIELGIDEKRKSTDNNEKKWLRILQYKLGRQSRDSLILSKMHGELTLYVQLAVMTLLFWFQNHFKFIPNLDYKDFRIFWIWYPVVFSLFIISACSVGYRRIRRAKDIKYFLEKDFIKEENSSEES